MVKGELLDDSEANHLITIKQLHSFQKLLKEKSYVSTINHILNQLSKDTSLTFVFNDGVESKQTVLEDIEVSDENECNVDPKKPYYHGEKYFRNLRKFVKRSKHMWFWYYSADGMGVFGYDRIKTISVHYCFVMLRRALYIREKLTAKQCDELILHDIESFSDDDTTIDLKKTIKPLVALANYQTYRDSKNKCYDKSYGSCDRQLNYFCIWYNSMVGDDYEPSYVDKVPNIKPQKDLLNELEHPIITGYDYKRFPASDHRINIDALQQFLRPIAYMLALPLHEKVHFEYTFFSGD